MARRGNLHMATAATCCAVLLLAAGCRPELVVQFSTEIFVDGSVERRIVFIGRTSEGESPEVDGWFADSAGVDLAEPGRWPSVVRQPGRIEAAGFFPGVDSLPPALAFENAGSLLSDPTRVTLEIEHRTILTRWNYRETYGDAYGPADRHAALQKLAGIASRVFREELAKTLGEEVDGWPAEAFFRQEGVQLASAILQWKRSHAGLALQEERLNGYREILRQAGVPEIGKEESDGAWAEAIPILLGWSRGEVARRLGTERTPVTAESLSFWPVGEDWSEAAESLTLRHWADEDAVLEELTPILETLNGRYSDDLGTRFRFEAQLKLPGTILHTNGTPTADGNSWIFREADLSNGDVVLRATSIEPIREVLVGLGARTEFSSRQLLQLEDLLWTRDNAGELLKRLDAAVSAGSLTGLREKHGDGDLWFDLARELTDLLEP